AFGCVGLRPVQAGPTLPVHELRQALVRGAGLPDLLDQVFSYQSLHGQRVRGLDRALETLALWSGKLGHARASLAQHPPLAPRVEFDSLGALPPAGLASRSREQFLILR